MKYFIHANTVSPTEYSCFFFCHVHLCMLYIYIREILSLPSPFDSFWNKTYFSRHSVVPIIALLYTFLDSGVISLFSTLLYILTTSFSIKVLHSYNYLFHFSILELLQLLFTYPVPFPLPCQLTHTHESLTITSLPGFISALI